MNIRNLSTKFSKDKDLSAYWAHLKPDTNLVGQDEENWKRQAAFLDGISTNARVAITLWNAFTNRFVFVSDRWGSYGGYSPELYTAENGMAFSLSNVHPGYLEASLLANEKGVQFFVQNPGIQVNEVLISFTLLYRRKGGDYFQILQQSTIVETDARHQPLLVLSYISDVSHIKKPGCADLVITSPKGAEMYNYDFENKVLNGVKPLSGQEREVIKLLGQGHDSKKIALALDLSPATVDTHRRNILKKTNCIDSTGAVSYAKLTGLI